LAPLPPVIEEDNAVGVGLVGSKGDALGRGSALGKLKGGKGGSLEPVGDGSDMLDDRVGFSGHRYGFVLLFYISVVSIFMPMDAEKRRAPLAKKGWLDSIRYRL